jgi:hypothetical protein
MSNLLHSSLAGVYMIGQSDRERATVMSNLLHSSLAGVKALLVLSTCLSKLLTNQSNPGQNHFAEPNVLWLFLILLTCQFTIHVHLPTYLPTYPVLTNCFT